MPGQHSKSSPGVRPLLHTHNVEDEEGGQGGVGLDSVGRHCARGLQRDVVELEADDRLFGSLHQQFHHHARVLLS